MRRFLASNRHRRLILHLFWMLLVGYLFALSAPDEPASSEPAARPGIANRS